MQQPLTMNTAPRKLARFLDSIKRALPEGRKLPEQTWVERHRGIVFILWLHAIGILAYTLLRGFGLNHVITEAGPITLAVIIAGMRRYSPRVRAISASLGLVISSGVLVHLAGGYIELHFHFFIMVVVISLYQDWWAFLIALAFVVLHHGIMGQLDPHSVYNHPDAHLYPWKWALIHGGFVLAQSVASIINWRLSESARGETELILNAAGEGIWGTDRQGRTTLINSAAAELAGSTRNDLIGKPIHAFIQYLSDDGDVLPWEETPTARVLSGTTDLQTTAARLVNPRGGVTPIEVVCRAVYNHGELVGAVVTFQDSTERIRAEQEKLEHTRQIEEALQETRRLELREREGRQELEQALAEVQLLQQAERETHAQVERAVHSYLEFVEQLATGNLAWRLEVPHDGALGALGHGLNQMGASLHTMTRQVQEASARIASTATLILQATTHQAGSSAEQLAALSEVMASVEEVKAIAEQTAVQAGSVAQESQGALQSARQGTEAVEETIQGMRQIKQRVQGIAETILTLSDQTQAIGVIITTVNELADQSNLLALNAAIEAARAGEQGKSFAVVAQHVRDLAERSKRATTKVRQILGEIQQATNAAVMVTEEGTRGVEAGTQQAAQAGTMIHRIVAEVERGAQANIQMASAAQQQTVGLDQIGEAMHAIQHATSETQHSTVQAERAAKDLSALAQALQQTIAAYRI